MQPDPGAAAARPLRGGERAGAPHPFEAHPHRTLMALSLPVMLSLVAEPLAGVVDTAFVERLGAPEAAALGAATAILSSVLWVFNFLGVGTQTELGQLLGEQRETEARRVASLAIGVSLALGVVSALALLAALDGLAAWMSDDPSIRAATTRYVEIRLVGFPVTLALAAAFGALRGLQDMRTPMWIAGGMSLLNVALDAVLVLGWGPVPALGIAGAAWATVASQVGGATFAGALVVQRIGWSWRFEPARVGALFVVGRDMVIRTAALLGFMLVATRVALQMGATAGAAHQAIRQVWMLLAFLLDAYAASTQSLVAYFRGAARPALALHVARLGVAWGLATGFVLSLLLWLLEPAVAALLVPPGSREVFAAAWPVFALSQPLSALSFVTDGIHWGTRDYAYLRNGMLVASGLGLAGLGAVEAQTRGAPGPPRLDAVWAVVLLWIAVRSAFGCLRIWPGVGRAPLRPADARA